MRKSFLGSVFLAAGEPKLVVPKNAGKGGRNLHMGLTAIQDNLITKEILKPKQAIKVNVLYYKNWTINIKKDDKIIYSENINLKIKMF